MKNTKNPMMHDRGFTLVETLVAIAVLLIALIGPLTLARQSLTAANVSKDQITAFYLAQDALEFVKNVRDTNLTAGNSWLTGITPCLSGCIIDTSKSFGSIAGAVQIDDGSCTPLRYDSAANRYGCTSGWTDSIFSRTVFIEELQPDEEMKATATITWTRDGKTYDFTASQHLFNLSAALASGSGGGGGGGGTGDDDDDEEENGAVTLDDFSVAYQESIVSTWSPVNHTLGASADYALALVSWEPNTVISVTFGGVAMNAGPIGGPGASGASRTQAFWLPESSLPSSGNVSVVVSTSGGPSAAGMVAIWTLSGAAQGAPNRSHTAAGGSGASAVLSLSSVPAGAFIASGVNDNRTNAPTLSGGTELFTHGESSSPGNGVGAGDSFPTSAGTITHTWSFGGNTRYGALMVEIVPGSGGGVIEEEEEPPTDYIAYWPLDSNANDVAGSHDGSLSNGASISTPAKIGSGALFTDGSNDYMSASAVSQVSKSADWSVSAWVYINSMPTGSPGTSQDTVWANTVSSSNVMGLQILNGEFIAGIYNGSSYYTRKGAPASTGTWYHTVVTFDGSSIHLWVNGTEYTSNPAANPSLSLNSGFRLGSRTQSDSLLNFNGRVDDMQIFDRELTDQEIQDIYDVGS